jgi:biotin carboxylase
MAGGRRKLLFLGAGVFQVAAIRKAVELGYRVLSVDYLPGNIGHRYSHEYANASTRDYDAVLDVARRHRIDGIFTMASDVALPTLARVASDLGLPGPDEGVVDTMINKDRFRPFQAEHGIDAPAAIEVEQYEEVVDRWNNGPAIIRPAVSSGSRGMARFDTMNGMRRAQFDSAREFSTTGKVCIEEYIGGTDLSVEGYVIGGSVRLAFVTQKHVEGFAVVGHDLPGQLPLRTRERAVASVQQVVTAIGYGHGPFDADLRADGERCVVLEMTPRLGGNAVPLLVEHAFGVPLIELALREAMGEGIPEADLPSPSLSEALTAVLLRSDRSGQVDSIAPVARIESGIEGLVDFCINLTAGDTVTRFAHGGHVFGYGILVTDRIGGFLRQSSRIMDALELTLH